jgi:hypothetical protein
LGSGDLSRRQHHDGLARAWRVVLRVFAMKPRLCVFDRRRRGPEVQKAGDRRARAGKSNLRATAARPRPFHAVR